MDAETAERLFEPFQTADPREQRAGLGLSIVHGIVRQNGGVVQVSSEPGQGTTVKVYLPMVQDGRAGGSSEPRVRSAVDETVLVVEDEDGVRELVRQILEEHGHAVLTGPARPRRAAGWPSATSVQSTCW